MALTKCPECGNKISTTAKSCPKCGYVLSDSAPGTPKPSMERLTMGWFHLVVGVLILLYGIRTFLMDSILVGLILVIAGLVSFVLGRYSKNQKKWAYLTLAILDGLVLLSFFGGIFYMVFYGR